MRFPIAIALAGIPATGNCTGEEPPKPAPCVTVVDELLDERAEKIPALVASIRERHGDDADSLKARAAYARLMTEIEEMENRIQVEIGRCPEAALRERERRREIPVRVQIDD